MPNAGGKRWPACGPVRLHCLVCCPIDLREGRRQPPLTAGILSLAQRGRTFRFSGGETSSAATDC